MKTFLQFLSEAETQASSQAKNMGLMGDGHGDWYDKKGNLLLKLLVVDYSILVIVMLVRR